MKLPENWQRNKMIYASFNKVLGENEKFVFYFYLKPERTFWPSVQFSRSHVRLCDPMDCSMPGFPVHHQLPELAQIHVHWVSDPIQLSHPLSFPSSPAFNLSQLRVFSNELVLHIRWPKYWSFNFTISPSDGYSGLISFRMDWLDLLAVHETLKSFQHHSSKASILGIQPSL